MEKRNKIQVDIVYKRHIWNKDTKESWKLIVEQRDMRQMHAKESMVVIWTLVSMESKVKNTEEQRGKLWNVKVQFTEKKQPL